MLRLALRSSRLLLIFLLAGFLNAQTIPATAPAPTPAPTPPTPVPSQPEQAVSSLPARIDAIRAQDPRAQHAIWGISVVDVASGAPIYSENAGILLMPASNTKLFTTSTALALIGGDYKFLTTVETASHPDKFGRISGDVLLVGRGDPNLSGRVLPYLKKTERQLPHTRVLEELADKVAAAGIKVIDGDIVGDDSYFVYERYGQGWSQDDLMWDYGAPVSALTINDNVVFASIKPGTHPGARALLTLDPYTNYYTVRDLVMTTRPGTQRNIGILREPGSLDLTFWGTIPMGDSGDDEALSIEEPATANAEFLRTLLQQRGIQVRGKARALHAELWRYPPAIENQPLAVPPAAPKKPRVVLAQHDSVPLGEDLTVINKVSQNLHVELLLRLIGKLRGTSGSVSAGLDVEKRFLAEQVGIDLTEFSLFDGSGLSREGLATPHAFTQLLRYAATQPWGTQWKETLPIAGEDGSLSTRFRGTFAADRVEAKTGQLGGVNSLTGYAITKSGKNIAFSIIVNHHQLGNNKAKQMIDDIVNAILDAE